MVCEVEEEEEKEEDEGLCDLGVKALRGILQPPLDMNLIILLVMCLIYIYLWCIFIPLFMQVFLVRCNHF